MLQVFVFISENRFEYSILGLSCHRKQTSLLGRRRTSMLSVVNANYYCVFYPKSNSNYLNTKKFIDFKLKHSTTWANKRSLSVLAILLEIDHQTIHVFFLFSSSKLLLDVQSFILFHIFIFLFMLSFSILLRRRKNKSNLAVNQTLWVI